MVSELLQGVARRALASALSLVGTSYLAHHLAREELGGYIGQLSLGQLIAGLALLSLDVTPVYLIRTYPGQARRIWHYSTGFSIALAATCLLLGGAAQGLGPGFGIAQSGMSRWGIASFTYAASYTLLQPQVACLQGLLKLRSYNVVQVLHPLAFLLSVVAFDLSGGRLDAQRVLFVWSAVNLCAAGVGVALVARAHIGAGGAEPRVDYRALGRAFISFGAGAYLGNLLSQVNARLPGILAALLLSAGASSLFAGVLILNDVFAFFSFAIASVTFPVLAGIPEGGARTETLALACRLTFGATLVAVVGFLVLFEPSSRLLLGARFATPEFLALCAAPVLVTALHATARIICTDFASKGRPFVNLGLNVPSALVFVGLFWILGGHLAEWGAMIAVCGAGLVFATLTFLLHRAGSGLRLGDIMVLRLADIRGILDLVRPVRPGRP